MRTSPRRGPGRAVVEVFRMLADPTRVQVLWALVDHECRSTSSPSTSASPRRRCPSIWRSCGWRGWCAPGGRARPSTTAWRTSTSASWSPTPCSTPSTRVPAFRRTTAASATAAPSAEDARTHARTNATTRPRETMATHASARLARRDHGDLRAAQPRCRRQRRRRVGVQRDRHPCGQDQPGGARGHRARAGGDRGRLRVGRAGGRHHPQLLRRVDRGAAVDRVRPRHAARRPGATPTGTAAPRTWPGCSWSR